ncbi:hypothetical protein R3P38DRAFT_3266925 [Favolaschia claudopus]|uniref:Uncharacterized protein n=1 Tax=Favolaschia claudopus TaxID=2862362 RepID=A0AAW0BY30_9AGAR
MSLAVEYSCALVVSASDSHQALHRRSHTDPSRGMMSRGRGTCAGRMVEGEEMSEYGGGMERTNVPEPQLLHQFGVIVLIWATRYSIAGFPFVALIVGSVSTAGLLTFVGEDRICACI